MIQEHEITAWLGDTDLTDEQRAHFARLVSDHHAQIVQQRPDYGTSDYHAADYAEDDTAAWVAALEIVLDDFDLDRRGQAFLDARTAAYQGAVMATIAGESEVQAAQKARISRITLRKALGK